MATKANILKFQSSVAGPPLVVAPPLPRPVSSGPPSGKPADAKGQPSSGPEAGPAKTPRLVSLDAFRGLAILGMLLVNNIALDGKTPTQLLHAEWSGEVHIADLVFPWFLFIVGVALPYSVASARRKHLALWQFDLKALWRAVSLIALGCLNDSLLAHKPVFDLDVLQLIGLAYFAAVLFGGLFKLPGRVVVAGLLLAANWAIIKLVNIPGHGVGHFTEDVNTIKYINDTYLARYHLNGLVSVIPTTALVLIGTVAGDLLRRKKIGSIAKMVTLLIVGTMMAGIGYLWGNQTNPMINLPMNKPDWTASYILYCGGWASIGLAIMYGLVDLTPGKWGQRAVWPLLIFGTNAIVAYVAPILTKAGILRNVNVAWPTSQVNNLEVGLIHWFKMHYGAFNGGWAYTGAYIAFWWCVLLVLYRKKWFLRV